MQHLMTVLISEHQRLFPCEPSTPEVSAQAGSPLVGERASLSQPPSLAGWISEEDLQGAPTPTPPASEDTVGSSSSLEACGSAPPLTPPQLRADPPNPTATTSSTSPSKQPKGAPSWKYSFKGAAAPRPSGDGGGGGTGGGASGGGNWLMNGLSSLRGHRRASSGERARERESGSAHHRLSTYDNVSSSSSLALSGGGAVEGAGLGGGGGASGTSSPWSTSSCEIFVSVSAPDSSSDQAVGLEPPPQTQTHTHTQPQQVAPLSASGDERPNATDYEEPDDASVAVEMCVNSGDGSGPAEDSDDSSPSLSNLVGGLKEELRKQKMVYEARIQK